MYNFKNKNEIKKLNFIPNKLYLYHQFLSFWEKTYTCERD
jgi:hypothetical protein